MCLYNWLSGGISTNESGPMSTHRLSSQSYFRNNSEIKQDPHGSGAQFHLYLFVTTQTMDDMSSVETGNATTIEAAPTSAPVDLAILEIHPTSVSFCWKHISCGDRNGEIIDYMYEVCVESGVSVSSGSVGSPKEAYVIKDLLPCADYSFRIAGKTSAGVGPFSANISVTAAPSPSLSGVEDLVVVEDESSTSLQVSWTYPMSTRCPIQFLVEYELLNMEQCEIGCSMIKEQHAIVSSSQLTIELLEQFSTYRVYLTPLNDGSTGPVRFATATTGEGVPLQLPSNVISTEAGPTSITVNVGSAPCGDRNGEIVGYRYILIGLAPFQSDQGFEVAQGLIDVNLNGISSSSISNLKPCYTYELRIAAGTNAGYGEYESVIVSTETTAPSSVKDLRASMSSNVIEISWGFETTTANPCRATTFFVDYQVLDIECKSNIPVPARVEYTETSEMLATLNDILPEAIYQIWVTAGNSAGKGPEMTIIVNSNAAAPIAAPQNVVYLESAESQVTFSWDEVPCELRSGVFVSYAYELIDQTDRNGNLDRNGNVRETSVTLTLVPNIAYFFRVAVANDYGLGPFSADISVPTVASDSARTLTIALIAGGTGIIMLVVIALVCSCVLYRRRLSIKRTVSKPTGYPGELQQMTQFSLNDTGEDFFQPWSVTMQNENGVYY
ncbi:receptor-type tyrosine-protein phosphatase F-like [Amphiura filiformis]|uniref:receptor-type tyrosine-protein phosphatase F-like n=1 Tax=Amphiura filiformis TaxID=82378 RepID=UPI003B20E67B